MNIIKKISTVFTNLRLISQNLLGTIKIQAVSI